MAGIGSPPYPSLDRGLWDEFKLAGDEGFANLGTYNPASRLPSGAPSDHARYPALAFDAGFSPAIGWGNQQARRFFNQMVGREGIHYVILGDRIWSTERGLHAYTYGGHENHVHVSGVAGGGNAGQPSDGTAEARQRVEFIAKGAYRRGLDPGSVLAVASEEGGFRKGQPGDQGTSYGPFQLHKGGSLPHEHYDDAQQWAWSPAGMNYALDRIKGVAYGLPGGNQSIEQIVQRFERPQDPESEIVDALDTYNEAKKAGGLPPHPDTKFIGWNPEPIAAQWRPWKRKFWTQSGADIIGSSPSGIAGALFPDSVVSFFEALIWPFQHPLRAVEILGGSVILLAGFVLLARSVGIGNAADFQTDPLSAELIKQLQGAPGQGAPKPAPAAKPTGGSGMVPKPNSLARAAARYGEAV